MSNIPIRLRRALYVRTHDQRLLEAATGIVMPPIVIPARTTLYVYEFGLRGDVYGVFARGPAGEKIWIDAETLRKQAYIPRAKETDRWTTTRTTTRPTHRP